MKHSGCWLLPDCIWNNYSKTIRGQWYKYHSLIENLEFVLSCHETAASCKCWLIKSVLCSCPVYIGSRYREKLAESDTRYINATVVEVRFISHAILRSSVAERPGRKINNSIDIVLTGIKLISSDAIGFSRVGKHLKFICLNAVCNNHETIRTTTKNVLRNRMEPWAC